jgi:alpha-D-ribose 1-methylphosphonate 5-triphosphate synthase subunit PhnG
MRHMNQAEMNADRARWMALLAKAPPTVFAAAVVSYGALPGHRWLRKPEVGLAMVRARTGGTGTQFNLGEMSLTRCALRLASGEMGVAYVAGRDLVHAERAAVFDALMQSDARPRVEQIVLQPIAAALAASLSMTLARAEATKVEFMTMVRGEDA